MRVRCRAVFVASIEVRESPARPRGAPPSGVPSSSGEPARHRGVLPAVARRLALGCALLGALACGGDAPIRIGVVLSSNGEVAAQLAADEINRQGGINGRRLDLAVIRENNPEAGPALVAAESLATALDVIAVVGHSNSATSLAASQIYNAEKVVQLAPTSSAPLLSEAGPWTFRLVASDTHQAEFIARHVAAMEPHPRVAALYVNDDYGRALHDQLMRQFAKEGVQVVHHAAFLAELRFTQAEDLANSLAASGAELLVWLGRANELTTLLPVLRERVPGIEVLGSDAIQNSASLLNRSGRLTGVRFVRFVDTTSYVSPSTLQQAVEARGMALSDEMLLSYDAVQLLAQAIREAGPQADAIRRYLETLGGARPPFEGVTGRIAFDANGDVVPRYSIDTIEAPASPGAGS